MADFKILDRLMSLPDGHLEAGRDYLRGLRKLGMHPEGLMWAFDRPRNRFVLLFIWSGIDKFGPLRMSELLFTAYKASALTQKVDPFHVYVLSADSLIASGVVSLKWKGVPLHRIMTFKSEYGWTDDQILNETDTNFMFQLQSEWIIVRPLKKRSSLDINRDWHRFEKNITALAA